MMLVRCTRLGPCRGSSSTYNLRINPKLENQNLELLGFDMRLLFCPLTVHSQIADRNALKIRHVSKGGENDEACQDTGEGVDDAYSQGVPVGKRRCSLYHFLLLLREKGSEDFCLITSEYCC